MNKLFTSIAVASLSLTMAVGVGVAVSTSAKQEATQVSANQGTFTTTPDVSLGADLNNPTSKNALPTSGSTGWVSSIAAGNYDSAGGSGYSGRGFSWANGADPVITYYSSGTTWEKVVVIASANSANSSLSVSVGGTTYTPSSLSIANGTANANQEYVFEGSSTGNVAVTVTNTSSNKSTWILDIGLYEASGSTSVTSVSLDRELGYTHVGTNLSLTATVLPATATDKTVSWSSSQTSVATVSDGTVTPVGPGTTTITVTTTDGGYTDTCDITVFATNHGLVESDPLSIAEAITIAKTLASGAQTENQYYVSGEVTSIHTAYNPTYGNISLNFTANSVTFIGYRLAVTQEYGEAIAAGDTVLFKDYIFNYNGTVYETKGGGSIITGTTYPEPALVVGTLAELFANSDGNYKQRYQVTGVVAAWYGSNTDATKYGNFYLTDVGETTQYYIYGATATSTALAWNENTGVYAFTNPQDFLTDTLTKDVALTYQVTMILTRCDHTSGGVTTPEACGIVTSVVATPSVSIDQTDMTLTLSGHSSTTLTATTKNDGGNSVVWSSSAAAVASIDSSTGEVTALSTGNTTITATLTVSGKDYTDTISITVVGSATGPIDSGRYYILNYDLSYGLSNAATSSAAPLAVDQSVSNQLIAFDVVLVDQNTYEISTTIDGIKYYLINNSAAASSANNNIRIMTAPTASIVSTNWVLEEASVGYYVKQNTTGSVYRYLSYNTDSQTGYDFRGYTSAKEFGGTSNSKQDSRINFVAEKSYAEGVADKILESCTSRGSSSYDTTAWGNASTAYAAITIEAEKNFLINGSAVKDSTVKLERALEQYDYAVSRYEGIDAFITGRTGIYGLANNASLFAGISTEATTAIIVVVALTSVTAIGAIFFIKRRKYN